jgi:hypothetical protein
MLTLIVCVESLAAASATLGFYMKPITQNALARLLKPHKVFPADVGPEHARRKGYKRAQFDDSKRT